MIVVEVVAEERKGLDEGAPSGHDLSAPPGDQVELGELLENPHRVVRAQDRHRAGETDALGPGRDRRQDHGGRGDEKVGPVVLADGEQVEPELIGQLGLLEELAHPLLRAGAGAQVREGGESEFHSDEPSR